ncbi:MAG: lipid-A-disaccharide synthase [Bacteroidales bacterium]|jgi:lipid-A-disaccharide synthase|nr:lipid-A-disaccharide synthase [Bacteroidales bacterium]
MKYYIIAGEASGDLHAANLIRALRQADPDARIRGFGGELMQQAGMELTMHYRQMAFMGFIPVLMHLRTIHRNMELCQRDIAAFQPDVVIPVDYPGFNLRIARYAHRLNLKVFYYISPKIWAWKTWRIHKIKEYVDEMFVILPFESAFYRHYGYQVHYIGNPVLDELSALPPAETPADFQRTYGLPAKPIIALLPGSRLQEINSLLPDMLAAARDFEGFQPVIGTAPNIPESVYSRLTQGYDVKQIAGHTCELLRQATVAVLASGTVSLEAGILRCPQIVCYRMAGGALFHFLAKRTLKVKWVSLVNLILNKCAVTELLQHHCTAANIRKELGRLLDEPDAITGMKADYEELHRRLGEPGASTRAARLLCTLLKENRPRIT